MEVGSAAGSEPLLQEKSDARRHVESCPECNRKVQIHKQVQGEISGLRAPGITSPGAQCPRDVDWRHVVAGIIPVATTRDLMAHAAQCDHCGPLLRSAVEFLSDEATPQEETTITALRSAQVGWQREI